VVLLRNMILISLLLKESMHGTKLLRTTFSVLGLLPSLRVGAEDMEPLSLLYDAEIEYALVGHGVVTNAVLKLLEVPEHDGVFADSHHSTAQGTQFFAAKSSVHQGGLEMEADLAHVLKQHRARGITERLTEHNEIEPPGLYF